MINDEPAVYVRRIIERHRAGQLNDYNDVHALINEIERLRQEFINLRHGIIVHATDTVWAEPAETAVDFITRVLRDSGDASTK